MISVVISVYVSVRSAPVGLNDVVYVSANTSSAWRGIVVVTEFRDVAVCEALVSSEFA